MPTACKFNPDSPPRALKMAASSPRTRSRMPSTSFPATPEGDCRKSQPGSLPPHSCKGSVSIAITNPACALRPIHARNNRQVQRLSKDTDIIEPLFSDGRARERIALFHRVGRSQGRRRRHRSYLRGPVRSPSNRRLVQCTTTGVDGVAPGRSSVGANVSSCLTVSIS